MNSYTDKSINLQTVFLDSMEKDAKKDVETAGMEQHATPFRGIVQMDVKST